jgi:hypothetical protein
MALLEKNPGPHPFWKEGRLDRPAHPTTLSLELMHRFLESDYCRYTSLRDFLLLHQNALTTGVLNQLHRRHIISWAFIKKFLVKIANTQGTQSRFVAGSLMTVVDDSIRYFLAVWGRDAIQHVADAQRWRRTPRILT